MIFENKYDRYVICLFSKSFGYLRVSHHAIKNCAEMLMTEETKIKLREGVEQRLDELTSEVERLNETFKKLERTVKFSSENELNISLDGIKNLLEYRLFIGILTLDLCTATLIYLRANFQYERLYSARQIVIIISEGYKKIYNFVSENKEGDLVTKYRNNSFWIKEIGHVIKFDLPNYQTQYKLITEQLDKYLEVNFETLKTTRDLSIHYDKEPIKVYNMLSELNIEETFKKMIPFLNILNEMFAFTAELNQGYLNKSENVKKQNNKRIDDIAYSLEKFKDKNDPDIITEFQEKILAFKKMFDK